MPTQSEKIQKYEQLLHKIQLFASVTMDAKQLNQLIGNICQWSYAHRQGNGALSEREQKKIIKAAFDKLTETE
jgi:hypothetical protein